MNKCFTVIALLFFSLFSVAHSIRNTLISFSVNEKNIDCTLQLPVKELQFAVGFDVTNNIENLFENHHNKIENYIQNHFYLQGKNGNKWQMVISEIRLETTIESDIETHSDLICNIRFIPNSNENIRNFTVFYDGILHSLITHKAIISIKKDWQNGIVGHQNAEIGTIAADLTNSKIMPFVVNLEKGNNWKGFVAMFWLGIAHIADGVDHLMFLLLLLLPAPLLVASRKWNNAQGWKNSFLKILKIVTGFTIGHSITLFFGTMQWFETPILLIEILIAVSIFFTAIHALKPIFYKNEILIAVVFGLIHGLAFSQTLVELKLTSTKMFIPFMHIN